MKKYVYIIICIGLFVAATFEASASKALVVAHYGSSDDATRAATIDRITADIATAVPADIPVVSAFISPEVIRKLQKRGLDAPSVDDALASLAAQGCDSVYVLSSTIIDGSEMQSVRNSADRVADRFKHIAVSTPLLFSPDDFATVAEVLAARPAADDEEIIYVGHGNMLPSTATYCMLDYMLKAAGHPHHHVSTIEGYPTAASTAQFLPSPDRNPKITLVPLLLVCGHHSHHDIAVEYVDALRAAGFSDITVDLHGLGENPLIRRLYLSRALQLLSN